MDKKIIKERAHVMAQAQVQVLDKKIIKDTAHIIAQA